MTPSTAAPATAPPPPCEIDALDPRFYDDPWEAYRWLRRHSPIHWDAKNELWVISRHADVSHISRNQELYSAADGVRPRVAAPMSIISMDDPEHTRRQSGGCECLGIPRGHQRRLLRHL